MTARARTTAWFWWGVAGQVVGAVFAAAGFLSVNPDNWTTFIGVALVGGGWSAMLVGIVAKGVDLGMRAANDE